MNCFYECERFFSSWSFQSAFRRPQDFADPIALDLAGDGCPLFHWPRYLGVDHQVRVASFFASQGIEPELAWTLQPLIGAFDVIMALLLLRKSNRAILIWMFLWALWTAMLRPLAGNLDKPVEVTEGQWVVEIREEARPDKTQTWEFWERAGNWGPPFMLLVMGGAFALSRKDLLGGYEEPEITDSTIDTIFFLCKLCLALLLIGHAGFGFAVQKQMLIDHWQSIGVKADATFISQIGYAELGLGILIFLAPVRPLVFLALGWKLFTEFLYVPADTVTGMGIVNIFEWIERWGDYGIPLVMLYILSYRAKREA